MRKVLLLTIGAFLCNYGFSQLVDDVAKNAWFVPYGTARSVSVGGAIGALGGDITSSSVNPAGLGFYKTSEVVFSPSFLMNNNKSDYRGSALDNIKKSTFQLGTTGVVFGGKMSRPDRSAAFSISLNQLASYNNKISYSGLNDYSSYSEQYLEQLVADNASVQSASNDYPFGSSLAFFTYLIDSISSPSGGLLGYRSLVPVGDGNSVQQQYDETTGGGLYEVSFGFASNHSDKLLLGASINVPLSFYTQDISYTETDPTGNTNNDFAYSTFTQKHTLNGYGINARLGLIYRPEQSLRLGLAIHTPSFMSYTDKLKAAITTDTEDYAGVQTSKSSDFDNAVERTQYNEITPYKIVASAAYVFREVENVKLQKGFITADIEYVNHRGSRFLQQADDDGYYSDDLNDYYKSLNDIIKSYYKGAFNFRLGGEIKFSPYSIRLGGAYYGSPYDDKQLKANRIMAAGGLGYRNHGFFIDLAIAQTFNKDVSFPYRLSDKANTYASLKNNRLNVLLTAGFKF
ncbi:hypothetical protein [Parafilimonas sp.]|uniref:hypothetical protein n=1 Tax=Parafilimonas sp. TaxID=1969739 RepID=UPI0039E477DA